jgi:hypothetical protein
MPQFAAVVAFDEKKWHDDEKLWFNWRVDSTEKSLMAFQRWGRDPFFRTRTPLMLPTVSAADATVWEADAADPIVSIPVTLSAPSPDLVTVQATTAAITNGSTEFVAVNRLVKFNPGVVRVLVDVKIRADLLDEPNERVDLVLSTPTNAVLGDAAGAITVADDDPAAAAPRIAVGNGAIVEGASYDRIVAVTVSLSHDHTTDVSVGWSLTGGTAVRDRDWAGTASGTLLFKPGQNSKTVNVRVLPDHLDEIDETMTITLTNPVGGTIADGSGTVTVVDDD